MRHALPFVIFVAVAALLGIGLTLDSQSQHTFNHIGQLVHFQQMVPGGTLDPAFPFGFRNVCGDCTGNWRGGRGRRR